MTRRLKLVLAATLVSVLAAACSDNGVAPLAVGPTTPLLGGFTAAVTCAPADNCISSRERRVISASSATPQSSVTRSTGPSVVIATTRAAR